MSKNSVFTDPDEEDNVEEFIYVPRESDIEERPRRAEQPMPRPIPQTLKKDVPRDSYIVLGKHRAGARRLSDVGTYLKFAISSLFLLSVVGGVIFAVYKVLEIYTN